MNTETKQTAHTPGPWKATYGNDMSISIVAPGNAVYDELSICRVSAKDNSKEREQNALLIASAPALLEALKDCRKYYVRFSSNESCDLQDLVGRTDTIIANAEGRA
jgi:hypothetical protein